MSWLELPRPSCSNTGAGWCLPSYTSSQLMSYAAAISTTAMFAGKFRALYPTLQTCAVLDAYSYTYHPQSISLTPSPASIGTELENEGCAECFFQSGGHANRSAAGGRNWKRGSGQAVVRGAHYD
jgi:hypothetical protein